jgi:hypothetical protein
MDNIKEKFMALPMAARIAILGALPLLLLIRAIKNRSAKRAMYRRRAAKARRAKLLKSRSRVASMARARAARRTSKRKAK